MHIDRLFESKITHPDNVSIFIWYPITPLYEDPAKVANVPVYIHVASLRLCYLQRYNTSSVAPRRREEWSTAPIMDLFHFPVVFCQLRVVTSCSIYGDTLGEKLTSQLISGFPKYLSIWDTWWIQQYCKNKYIFLGFNCRVTLSYRRGFLYPMTSPPLPHCNCASAAKPPPN